jgi:hypothetical protein
MKVDECSLLPLEIEIVEGLNGIIKREIQDDRDLDHKEWTKNVKEVLADIGRRCGCKVAASGIDNPDDSEWMLDMVWATECGKMDEEARGSYLEDVILGMECEWNYSTEGLDWDFQKLLAVRARHRLLIFEQRRKDDIDRIFKRCLEQITFFKQSIEGDRYLLVGSWRESEQFETKAFKVKRA